MCLLRSADLMVLYEQIWQYFSLIFDDEKEVLEGVKLSRRISAGDELGCSCRGICAERVSCGELFIWGDTGLLDVLEY